MNNRGVGKSLLAKAIGVTQDAISLILLGKTRRSKFLSKIAIELNVSQEWLIGRDVDKHDDCPVDLLVTADERDLPEAMRDLSFQDR